MRVFYKPEFEGKGKRREEEVVIDGKPRNQSFRNLISEFIITHIGTQTRQRLKRKE